MSHLCFFYFDIKINDIVGEVVRLITDFIIIIQMDLEEKKKRSLFWSLYKYLSSFSNQLIIQIRRPSFKCMWTCEWSVFVIYFNINWEQKSV